MNFFEHQAKARRNTTLLVFYFILATLLIVLAVNAAVFFTVPFLSNSLHIDGSQQFPVTFKALSHWFQNPYWLYISLGTLGVIFFGSLIRLSQLSGGGEAVANMVKAREVSLDSQDKQERILVNVVEEMAIASGIPMPRLYVMDNEDSINAFVAGFKATESVLVVTRGTLENLSRDELQGVIGHEFSHIFNGDMRINIRLMAILAGILAIGQIGQFLLRSSYYSGHGHRSRSDKNGGVAIQLALGLALLAIGYIGLFFGRLIKAAISRQREYLADASAVQFTRNPAGIAEALIKIRNGVGSHLLSPKAEDMSHMCFGETLAYAFSGLLATHPPLDERIAAIGPEFLTKAEVREKYPTPRSEQTSAPNQLHGVANLAQTGASAFSNTQAPLTPEAPAAITADFITGSVGKPTSEHMVYAASLVSLIPDSLHAAIHSEQGAQSVIYCLLIPRDDENNKHSFMQLKDHINSAQLIQVTENFPVIHQLGSRLRLPLQDLAIPALKQLDFKTRKIFLANVNLLIKADNKVNLFEYTLFTLLKKHLGAGSGKADKVRYHRFNAILNELNQLISILIHLSGEKESEKTDLHQRVIRSFSNHDLSLLKQSDCNIQVLDTALKKLDLLNPILKKTVLNACADCVLNDGIIQVQEAETLRAIAGALNCPMPPVLSMQNKTNRKLGN